MELVFDGSQLTHENWAKLYPPHVPECKQLPGTKLPEWHYSHSECTSCALPLNLCHHNPFAVDGSITKQRRSERSSERSQRPLTAPVATVTPPKVVIVPVKVSKVKPGDFIKGRRGRVKRTVDVTKELVKKALVLLRAGQKGMVEIANENNVNPAELSAALKAKGFIPQRGRKKGA